MNWIKQWLAADAAHWHKLWSMRLAIFWGCFNGVVLGLFFLGDYVNPLLLFRFSGGKSAFPKNKGTGGLFDLKGVIENYTPEPSFTVT